MSIWDVNEHLWKILSVSGALKTILRVRNKYFFFIKDGIQVSRVAHPRRQRKGSATGYEEF